MINYDNYGCYYCCNNANALNTILIYYIAGLGSLVLLVCILFLPFSSSLFLFSIRNTTTGRMQIITTTTTTTWTKAIARTNGSEAKTIFIVLGDLGGEEGDISIIINGRQYVHLQQDKY